MDESRSDYDKSAAKLKSMFVNNFHQFSSINEKVDGVYNHLKMTKAADLIGVDGTSSGWIASIGNSKNKYLSIIKFFENLDELLSNHPDSVIVIDMPIELNKKTT